jgi:hypothetical protein
MLAMLLSLLVGVGIGALLRLGRGLPAAAWVPAPVRRRSALTRAPRR